MPKKRVQFADYCHEPTDTEFITVYHKYTSSLWFVIIFYLCCWPPIYKALLRIATSTNDFETTCLIPAFLNNSNWTLPLMRRLTTTRQAEVCTYLDYNYSKFVTIHPKHAFRYKREIAKSPEKSCALPVTGDNLQFRKYSPKFLESCSGFNYREKVERLRSSGYGLAPLFWGPLADLYGRKRSIILSFAIFGLGVLISCLADDYYKLSAGFCIEGIGSGGMTLINIILFMELCHEESRGTLVLSLACITLVSKVVGFILMHSTAWFMDTYYLYSIPALALVFYAYYMPESPLWLLSFGKKKEAWKILEERGENIEDHFFLPESGRSHKLKTFMENFKILFYVKRYYRTILIMCWIKCIRIIAITNFHRFVRVSHLNASSHIFHICMAETLSLFIIMPTFILFGRYVTIYLMLITGGGCIILRFFTKDVSIWYTINIVASQYFYGLEYVSLLYTAELIPTPVRGTGLGLVLGMAKFINIIGKMVVALITKGKRVDNIEAFIMLGCILLAVCLLPFLPNSNVGKLPDWKRHGRVSGI